MSDTYEQTQLNFLLLQKLGGKTTFTEKELAEANYRNAAIVIWRDASLKTTHVRIEYGNTDGT
jgi:hypothetical protein